MEQLLKSDFYFDLPEELIAQDPLEDRSSSQKEIFFYSLGASIPNSPWQTDIQTHGKNSRFFRRKEG